MRTYWCQGHGTTFACCGIVEDFCGGHGQISYCDGSCSSAQRLLEDDITAGRERPVADSTDHITLHVGGYGRTPESYFVTFEGPQAEAVALAYVKARPDFYFSELVAEPFSHTVFAELAKALYPVCEHGLDASLCMDPGGPHHFGTREWEMAFYGE